MRFAELARNTILAAVAAQSAPWASLLDAYAVSRLRADAHPGPKQSRAGRAVEDCLHYCLPGVPDVLNGRLLQLIRGSSEPPTGGQPLAGYRAMEGGPASGDEAGGGAIAVLRRWNFELQGRPFVQEAGGSFALSLGARAPAVRLECGGERGGTSPDWRQARALGECPDALPKSKQGRAA